MGKMWCVEAYISYMGLLGGRWDLLSALASGMSLGFFVGLCIAVFALWRHHQT